MIKNCKNCKKDFKTDRNRTIFCNYSCFSLNEKGVPRTKEVIEKIKQAHKNGVKFFHGEKHKDETKEKQSLSHKGKNNPMFGMSGNKNPRWIEDKTQLKKSDEKRTSAYNYWRKQVYTRDNFKCKINNSECNGRIEAHHILSWRNYPDLRYEVNNGITLCHFHHPTKYSEEERLSPYFQEIVNKLSI